MKTNSSSIASHAPRPGLGVGSWHGALMNLVRRGVARIKYRRKVRRDLARLLDFDDHMLRDIGLSRAEVSYLAGYGRLLTDRHDRRLLDLIGRREPQR
jgi:uncharacterized protein YjiS (DUF1127 family)